mgnify:CR=1 FL=1
MNRNSRIIKVFVLIYIFLALAIIRCEPEIEEEPSDKKSKFYSYKGYDLYKKEIITKNGNKRTVHFFSKNKQKDAKKIKLPKGYIVKQNKKTKVPYLKKKK